MQDNDPGAREEPNLANQGRARQLLAHKAKKGAWAPGEAELCWQLGLALQALTFAVEPRAAELLEGSRQQGRARQLLAHKAKSQRGVQGHTAYRKA